MNAPGRNPESAPVSNATVGFGLSLAICAIANALIVIAKEKSKAVADWMQKLTGHHWITHVAIVLVLYFAAGWWFTVAQRAPGPAIPVRRLTHYVLGGVIAGVIIILAFYIVAD